MTYNSHTVLQRYNILILLPVLMLFSIGVKAQTLDHIVAKVGKKRIILQSEILVQAEQMKMQNPDLTDNIECDLMEQMLLQKVLVEQAERDSIYISEEEIEATLDNRVRYFIMQYGSKEKLEEIAGKTVYQLKEENREITEEIMLSERMQTNILESVKVTPVEVQKFYNNIPVDSLPFFPATVELGQIVIDPDVSPELDTYARRELEKIRKDIVDNGKDFAVMAGIHSDDPGSRDEGGLMQGISRKGGNLVQEFAVAAFKLQNGEVSPIIRTRFGYHIIKMESRKGDEADVRHILIKPQKTSADFDKAMEKLDSVRAKLISGKITFEKAVGEYSTDEFSNRTGGMITDQQGNSELQVEDLDPTLALLIDSLKKGEYSKPMLYTNERGERSCRIVYMKSITRPHKANLEEDYSKIQFAALQKKKGEHIQKWIADRAPSYYIKVDTEYKQCPNLEAFLTNAEN